MPHEPTDYDTPASILEQREDQQQPQPSREELALAIGRLLAWIMDGQTPSLKGYRAMIICWKLRPDLIHGATLATIAKSVGYGRTAAHNLVKNLSKEIAVRGLNERSPRARLAYKKAWHRAHPSGSSRTGEDAGSPAGTQACHPR